MKKILLLLCTILLAASLANAKTKDQKKKKYDLEKWITLNCISELGLWAPKAHNYDKCYSAKQELSDLMWGRTEQDKIQSEKQRAKEEKIQAEKQRIEDEKWEKEQAERKRIYEEKEKKRQEQDKREMAEYYTDLLRNSVTMPDDMKAERQRYLDLDGTDIYSMYTEDGYRLELNEEWQERRNNLIQDGFKDPLPEYDEKGFRKMTDKK